MALDKSTSNQLVNSHDVKGTPVHALNGEKVGEIDHLMIDKTTGKVSYAVMGFGGFLGIGEDHHPIPWGKLSYDTDKDGFVTDITKEELEAAPGHTGDWLNDRAWETRLHDHYMVPYYWV